MNFPLYKFLMFFFGYHFIGFYHWTSEAGEESGSHVKGQNAGNLLRNICYAFLEQMNFIFTIRVFFFSLLIWGG